MNLAQKLSYTVSHNYKQYGTIPVKILRHLFPPQLVAKCHNYTTLEDCSVSQNCARFFVGLLGQFSFALIPAGESRHDGAVKHILQVLLSQRAALYIQLTPCTAVKSLILLSFFQCFGSALVSMRIWMRILIKHFRSMRIRIWIQIQFFDDQKLEKISAENFNFIFLMKNCNLVIPGPL
jgi:hypothetical protein